jgi:hypothetical protein
MFAGPFLGSLVMQWYIWITVFLALSTLRTQLSIITQTGTLVRAQGIITQLVFEHALRIRVKAEAAASTPAPSAAPTPDTLSVADGEEGHNLPAEGAEGHGSSTGGSTDTEATLQASSASVSSKGKGKAVAAKEDKKEEKKEDAKDKNLIGKINNLVATDLDHIIEGRDFLFIGVFEHLERVRSVKLTVRSTLLPAPVCYLYVRPVAPSWLEVSRLFFSPSNPCNPLNARIVHSLQWLLWLHLSQSQATLRAGCRCCNRRQ